MEKRKYDETAVLDFIERNISDAFLGGIPMDNKVYHHNTSFGSTPSIIRQGILPIEEINKLNIAFYSEKSLAREADILSHPNGIDGISLSKLGLDDLYEDEFEYDPRSSKRVDLIISGDIRASRNSTNYGNEFICYEKIDPSLIKSVDIRLLKLIESCRRSGDIRDVEFLINCYNSLRDIARQLIASKSEIPLREMSDENNVTLDVERISHQRLLTK